MLIKLFPPFMQNERNPRNYHARSEEEIERIEHMYEAIKIFLKSEGYEKYI